MTRLTYRAWVDQWLETTAPSWAPSTRQTRRYVLTRYLLPLLGDYYLDEIDEQVADEFQNNVLAQSDSAASTRNAMKLLQNTLNAAQQYGLISHAPKIEHDGYEPSPHQPVDVETLERIRVQLTHTRDKALFSLMAYCGLPPREALALKWGDFLHDYHRVSPVRKYLTGEVQPLPTAQYRTVDVAGVVRDDLNLYLPTEKRVATAWVFPGSGDKPRSFNSWRTDVWYPACRAAKVDVRPNQLRQAYATLLYREGRTVTHIAAALGATSRTRVYNTLLAELDPPTETESLQEVVAAARARIAHDELTRRPRV